MKSPTTLTEEQIEDIVCEYFYINGKTQESIGNDASVYIANYYGIYNGNIAIMFNTWKLPAITTRYVEDVPLWFSSRNDVIYIFVEQ